MPKAKAKSAAAAAKAAANQRQKGLVLCQPIVCGSIAFWLGRKSEDENTHEWTIYVRGLQCEDQTHFISKVAFQLHRSFENNVRIVERPPFEVTAKGWGEFEIGIRIYFTDPSEKPVDLFHVLRLYPPGNQQLNVKKPVVSENYDEIVFTEPTRAFSQKLLAGPTVEAPPHPHAEFFTTFSEAEDLRALNAAR